MSGATPRTSHTISWRAPR